MTILDSMASDTSFANPHFGFDAVYTSLGYGQGVAVRVIRVSPQDVVTGLVPGLEVVSSPNLFDVRQSDVAAPAEGDTLSIGADSFVVQGAPRLDASRSVWHLECRKAP